jgi:HK97 family phage prohead protease
MLLDRIATPVEFKFDGGTEGVFTGYGAVTGNQDSYGHVIAPGAFKETLAAHTAAGTMPGMYAEHSAYQFGGDPLPVGVWTHMSEDSKGLICQGKICALNTDHGQRVYGLMKEGAIKALSIAFNVPDGGDVRSSKKDEPHRTINNLVLHSVDVVRDPANKLAKIVSLNTVMKNVDAESAATAVAACMKLHQQSLSGANSPTSDQRQQMFTHLMDAHQALTGQDMPMGMNSAKPTTIREFESWLREEFKLSHSQARAIAELGFKAPRDEAVEQAASEARKATLKELSQIVSGFSLTSEG